MSNREKILAFTNIMLACLLVLVLFRDSQPRGSAEKLAVRHTSDSALPQRSERNGEHSKSPDSHNPENPIDLKRDGDPTPLTHDARRNITIGDQIVGYPDDSEQPNDDLASLLALVTSSAEPSERQDALKRLGRYAYANPSDLTVVTTLQNVCRNDPADDLRMEALQTLIDLPDSRSFEAVLASASGDRSADVRLFTIRRIRKLADRGYSVFLEGAGLSRGDARTLAKQRLTAAENSLSWILQSEHDERVRVAIQEALAVLKAHRD